VPARATSDAWKMTADVAAELKEILACYDLGALVGWERNDRGYCNVSYSVDTILGGERRRYFFRKYRKGIERGELVFEHAVIDHLLEQGFGLVARAFRTRDGETFVQRCECQADEQDTFYAVFDFLPGEDRYTWIDPACSDQEVKNAATVLAQFHGAVFCFVPPGSRSEPKVVELLPAIAEYAVRCLTMSKDTVFDAYLLENVDLVLEIIDRTRNALHRQAYEEMPQLVIHGDYHPGNLKFQDDGIVGLFDFDWCKIDARCFDVALAIFYFFAAWEDGADGELDLRQLVLFLRACQDALERTHGLGPLSEIELEFLPHLINAANLYVLNWTLQDFYAKQVDPQEYLIYLRHGVRVIKWLDRPECSHRLHNAIRAPVGA
jgi:homoserine kinase type II